MSHDDLLARLPHGEPMRLVTAVESVDPGLRVVARYDVPTDAFWVPGHFPGDPVLPGVLVVEALAQVAGLVYLSAHPERAGTPLWMMGVDRLRLRRAVRPGESLRLEVGRRRRMGLLWSFDAEAFVGEERAADCTLMATVPPEG